MNEPLISVIIPCYQSEETLANTLVGVIGQTHNKIEIICVNDGSTDSTTEILNKFKNKISILNQTNKGAPSARNNGFNRSKGEFLLFCDDDVQLKKDMLEKMLDKLQKNPDKAYCYSNFKFGIHTFDLFPFDAEKLKHENYISTMSLIRREKFIGFDETLDKFQDWDLWKRMLAKGDEGIWYPERLFSAPIK